MAELARGTGDGSLTTPAPPSTARPIDGYASAKIKAITPCYQDASGKFIPSSGAADGAAAVVDGWTMQEVEAGEKTTLYKDVKASYGRGNGIVAGIFYYLSATIPGGLSDTPPFAGAKPVARGVKDNNVSGTQQNKLLLLASY